MTILKLSLSLLLATTIALQANAKQIDFYIENINFSAQQKNNGKLYVQLFDSEEGYKRGNAAAASVVRPKGTTAVISFNDLQAGEYALRFFHDQNNNGKMETNLMGLPTEGYGFSNNARPNFGPVSYEQIKFTLGENQRLVVNKTQVIY